MEGTAVGRECLAGITAEKSYGQAAAFPEDLTEAAELQDMKHQ